MPGTGLTGPPNTTLEAIEINAGSLVSWTTLTRIERHSMWYRERGREKKTEMPGKKRESETVLNVRSVNWTAVTELVTACS